MTKEEYDALLVRLPEFIVLDITAQSQRLISAFGSDAEYVMLRIFKAITDGKFGMLELNREGDHVMSVLEKKNEYARLHAQEVVEAARNGHAYPPEYLRAPVVVTGPVADSIFTYEQVAMSIWRYLRDLKLYVGDRYLPYTFQTICPDGSVLLQRIDYFEYMMDLVPDSIEPA